MRNTQFDFRTKLLVIVLTMSLVAVITSDILIYSLLALLGIYLFFQGFGRQAIKYFAACAAFIVLRLLSDGNGVTILMPEMFLFIILRIMMMVMAAQPVIGMPPGEIVAVFKKIHAPDSLALPVTFTLRFFPTVRSEFTDVFSALKLRGLLSWQHPLDAAEYVITPVIFRCSRIAEELAASAESRGISNPGIHTRRRIIQFRKQDTIMCVIAYFVMQNTDCQLFGDSVLDELRLNDKHGSDTQLCEVLEQYGLLGLKDSHPATLSGGQKQRLTLAVSDRIDTPILIPDEPTSGLDFRNVLRISQHLRELAYAGKTVLIITHDYEFAAMTCNCVLHFNEETQVEMFPMEGNLDRLYDCLMRQ